MSKPILYLKSGCPWCDEAEDYLREHAIEYQPVDVSQDAAAFAEMRRVSSQTKAPTMVWENGDVLADFGAEELDAFLRQRNLVR